ncbi:transporter substrate-binding domain-containing protein [Nitratidesulfovibrio liaohensis]|uniref:Transporter substrate-binding domain-containing protein n=1 Tax=Nitratidesulfovibrio liaohensis TaxID=2604158 RepID=A0ABY9R5T2_9BACT|nr:transporter substrate-binding domain-containing protein [Nitratidesulfovibrio liaohensis]WMW65970.1 transporter substrate-binding domain-containing protein [Nitratidesulfovibrio liaohensis]
MRCIVLLRIKIFFPLILTLFMSEAALCSEEFYVMSEQNAPPYVFIENGKKKGIDYDIIIEAARRMGIDVKIDFVPWLRMYKSLENGACDGGSAFFHIKERESFVIYINPPIHHSSYVVFVRSGEEFEYSSPASLYGKRVGVTRGYRLNKEFSEAVTSGKINIEEVDNVSLNIQKIVTGRLDCMVSNRDATLIQLRNAGLSGKIVPLEHPVIEARGLHLVLSRAGRYAKDRNFISRLESVLRTMKEDGTFQNIYSLYGLP